MVCEMINCEGVDEICVIVNGEDIDAIRAEMYKYDFLMFNRWEEEGMVWFVRKSKLIEMVRCIADDLDNTSMDYSMLDGINGVLLDPLGYEWRWLKMEKDGGDYTNFNQYNPLDHR